MVHHYRLMGAGLRGSTPSAPKLVISRPVNVRPLAEPGMVQYAAYPARCKKKYKIPLRDSYRWIPMEDPYKASSIDNFL